MIDFLRAFPLGAALPLPFSAEKIGFSHPFSTHRFSSTVTSYSNGTPLPGTSISSGTVTVLPVRGQDGQLVPINAGGAHFIVGVNSTETPSTETAPTAEDQPTRGDKIRGDDAHLQHMMTGPDQTLATPSPQLTSPDGSPLPTDAVGHLMMQQDVDDHEIGRGEIAVLPTDPTGKFIHPLVDADSGQPLSTDQMGRYVDHHGELVPTDDFGRPLDRLGNVLPTTAYGQFLYHFADAVAGQLSVGEIVTESGEALPRDADGEYTDFAGRRIRVNARGEPIGWDGKVLDKNGRGQFVWKSPVVVGTDGAPLPTDAAGLTVDQNGNPLPTNSDGIPISADGMPLSTDATGRFVWTTTVTAAPSVTKALPTEESGKILFPIVDQFGRPLPTDASGHFIDQSGEQIPLDQFGQPLGPDGLPLMTNSRGEYVVHSLPAIPLASVGPTTVPIALPFPALSGPGREVEAEKGEEETEEGMPPTDSTGRLVLPVISADTGQLMPRNEEGQFVNAHGEVIPTDDFGRPFDWHGKVLPRNELGQFVFHDAVQWPDDHQTAPSEVGDAASTALLAQREQQQMLQRRRNQTAHCFVGGFVELLNVFDTSANVKILDYRMMKEAVKSFLMDHFDLRPHHGVRVGLLKYGDTVEVPITLGDYDTEAELLVRMGETRRLKGEPNLEAALREAAGEFHLSGADEAPRVVIVWKSGTSSSAPDKLRHTADLLRQQYGALVLVVTAGGLVTAEDRAMTAGHSDPLVFDGWAEADADALGVIADTICRVIPQARGEQRETAISWPTRATSAPSSATTSDGASRDCTRIEHALDLVLVVDSSTFSAEQFAKVVEGLATLVDESFDLAPDVVRVGLIVYSEMVAVPVALGHYEDKIELLSKMVSATHKINGTMAIALRGLEAARQQFQLHGRQGVPRVVLLLTNGKHRGNAAPVAAELREQLGVQIVAVAVAPSLDQLNTLTRIVADPTSVAAATTVRERLLRLDSVDQLADAERIAPLRRALCTAAATANRRDDFGSSTRRRHTVATTASIGRRRSATVATREKHRANEMAGESGGGGRGRVTRAAATFITGTDHGNGRPVPLCPDGHLRPLLITVLMDMTLSSSATSRADFDIVLSHLAAFLERHFSVESQRLRLNLIGVDENGLIAPVEQLIPVEQFSNKTKKLKEWRTFGGEKGQKWKSSAAPNLSKGLQASAKLSQNAIDGQESVLILISREGTSSISELDGTQQQQQMVAISVDYPLSNLLKKMAGNSANRVIHFPDWTGDNVPKQFSRWLTLAICSAINASTMARRKVTPSPSAQNNPKLIQNTTQMPKWLQLQRQNALSSAVSDLAVPRHVLIRPVGSDSLLISWSPCCEPHRPPFNLSLLYSSDPLLRFPSLWSHRFVSCAENSAVRLDHLPSGHDYTVCVLNSRQMVKAVALSEVQSNGQCDSIWLGKGTIFAIAPAKSNCAGCPCGGNGQQTKTVPPCAHNQQQKECACAKSAKAAGECPAGFTTNGRNICEDINECMSQRNGGCSHGCVNTEGSFYCACPPGMVVDPAHPRQCLPIEGGLKRAADLFSYWAKMAKKPERRR
ncbi:hypothetical protein niasHS_010315 [Heterodera schachtii]|uniref:Uncharacterized protein n=1 Tax=Heterodera schachtii TaxID=97005 RepID=A0ABD2J148_HETSC